VGLRTALAADWQRLRVLWLVHHDANRSAHVEPKKRPTHPLGLVPARR